MSDEVKVQRRGKVLLISIDRPAKKNALTNAMYEALTAAIDLAEVDSELGAVVIAGTAGAFTAGNDIADFLAVTDADPSQLAGFAFIKRLAAIGKPLVAAVDGVAVGIGTTMLLHSDLVYATPEAYFRMPFIDLGLVPEGASSLIVPQRFGLQKATEWLLLGEEFAAAEAHRCGLVNAIIPAELLLSHALDAARRLAAKPRDALSVTRRLLRGDPADILARIEEEARAFAIALQSDDSKRAFAAFLAKGKS